MNFGVMKDYKLELRNLRTSDALGGAFFFIIFRVVHLRFNKSNFEIEFGYASKFMFRVSESLELGVRTS
jgi:hypothetical protein